MLSAIPLLNNNNTVAMAQEYDKYRDSYYSQYPTDDKKYQCRTGPFEGFFVSSVEFCKHVKFDDKKDIVEIIIEQVHKVHLVHKDHKEFKVQLVLMEHKVLQVSLTQNYVHQIQT